MNEAESGNDDDSKNEEYYSVKNLLDCKRVGDTFMFEVEWTGHDETSWEPYKNLAANTREKALRIDTTPNCCVEICFLLNDTSVICFMCPIGCDADKLRRDYLATQAEWSQKKRHDGAFKGEVCALSFSTTHANSQTNHLFPYQETPVSLVDLRKALNGDHQLQGGESKKREHSEVDGSKVNTQCRMPFSVELALNCDFIQIVTKRKQNSAAKKVRQKVEGLIF